MSSRTDPPSSRTRYSREEMDAILQRALQKQSQVESEITHEELVAAAAEVGIPREHIEEAVRDIQSGSGGAASRGRPGRSRGYAPRLEDADDESERLATERTERIQRWRYGLRAWLFTSVIFFVISHETHMRGPFIAVPVIWGLVLALRGLRLFAPGPPRRRRETRAERRERRRREKQEDFERKIAVGTEAIGKIIDRARGVAPSSPATRAAASSGRDRVGSEPDPRWRVDEVRLGTSEDEEDWREHDDEAARHPPQRRR